MDLLGLLEADSIEAEEAVSAAESALPSLPAPDFTGSLDYIDSLANRSSVSISQRDVANIATGLSEYDYLSTKFQRPVLGRQQVALTDFTSDSGPLQDRRLFDPEGSFRRHAAAVRSSSDVVSSPIRSEFPPNYRNPLDPGRDVADLNFTMSEMERRVRRQPFAFRKPSQVDICLKRKIRKGVMHALNVPYMPWYLRAKPKRSYWSRVIC